jgi:hypothetical protein
VNGVLNQYLKKFVSADQRDWVDYVGLVAVIFISILLGSSSCDFQWSDKAIYIHEFIQIRYIHPKMKRYHLKIWEHFSDFIHSKIGNLSLKIPFVSLLSDKSPKKKCWLAEFNYNAATYLGTKKLLFKVAYGMNPLQYGDLVLKGAQ